MPDEFFERDQTLAICKHCCYLSANGWPRFSQIYPKQSVGKAYIIIGKGKLKSQITKIFELKRWQRCFFQLKQYEHYY